MAYSRITWYIKRPGVTFCKKVRADRLILLYILREQKLKSFSECISMLLNQLTTSWSYKPTLPPTIMHSLYYCDCIVVRGICLFVFFLSKSGSYYMPNILKITLSTWPRLDRLENRSYSIIQPHIFTTYNMKIKVWPAILDFFDFLESKIDPDYTPKFSQILKKLNNNLWMGSISPVTNPSGVLTNINLT